MAAKMKQAFQEFCEDIFVTAVEGGIDYWFIHTPHTYDPDLGRIEGTPYGEEEPVVIDLAVVWAGVNSLIALGDDLPNKLEGTPVGDLARLLEHHDAEGWLPDLLNIIDAEYADYIVQYGLFGDLVYG